MLRVYWKRPLTRLETSLYAVMAAILLALFIDRLLQVYEIAERTSMETTLLTTTSALNYQAALALVAGAPPASWEGQNPFRLARVVPSGYVEGGVAAMTPGTWSFDDSRGEAVYYPRLSRALTGGKADGKLRFQVKYDQHRKAYMLVPTSEYRWKAE